MGQVISIVSQKGGVGKTSTAVNLGACLSAMKQKVLLMELDPQCGLARCFRLDAPHVQFGLLDLLRDGAAPSEVVYLSHRRLPNLDVIPANVQSSADEMAFVGLLQDRRDLFTETLDQIATGYDYVFIDCPPRLDYPTTTALVASDFYLVPIQCEYAAMATVGRVLRAALEVKRRINPLLGIYGFLITMADKRASFTIKIIQEVRQYLKERVFKTVIPRDPYLAEVPKRGEPILAYELESPGAKAYIRLAKEILTGAGHPQRSPE
jgi:chromosome partitioning protein